MSIAVLGEGKLGTAVIAAVRELGEVTIATRSNGYDVLNMSYDGYDTVINCTGMSLAPGSQEKICAAVLKAGVKRYFPWQFGLDYDAIGRGSTQNLFDEQLNVRDMLRAQDKTEWCIISVGLFMDHMLEHFGDALGSWDNKLTVTTAHDVGRAVAMALKKWQKNRVLFVAGDTLTWRELKELTGRGELVTMEEIAKRLEKEPENVVLKYQGVWAAGIGVAWEVEGAWNTRMGLRFETVREYLEANSPAER